MCLVSGIYIKKIHLEFLVALSIVSKRVHANAATDSRLIIETPSVRPSRPPISATRERGEVERTSRDTGIFLEKVILTTPEESLGVVPTRMVLMSISEQGLAQASEGT